MRTRGTYLVTFSVPSEKLSLITTRRRKMAKPVRWTEEEKRQMVITRSQNQHMSWEEFQKVSNDLPTSYLFHLRS
jgi:hypothetical protein